MSKVFFATGLIAGLLISASVSASEQVYRPVSPTFGGNPLNGSFLLSTAQAQGKGAKSGQQSPDLSGLPDALKGVGGGSTAAPIVIVGGNSQIPASP